MDYDKLIIDNNGEEYPYSESLDDDGYFYKISVVWDDRDGELVVLNAGAHLEFDDDGSWLDFNVTPEKVFPNSNKLDKEQILKLLSIFADNESKATLYSKQQIEASYEKFQKIKK